MSDDGISVPSGSIDVEAQLGPVLDFGDDDHHPLTRGEALLLRNHLSAWLRDTAHQLPPAAEPCDGRCSGAWAVGAPDGTIRCELCGTEVEF